MARDATQSQRSPDRGIRPTAQTLDEQLCAVAHDLRLPLSHIKGFISSLRRPDVDWGPALRAEFLADIEHEADRMAGLLDELLERSCSHRQVITPPTWQPTRPTELVAAGLDRVGRSLAWHVVQNDVSSELPTVLVDVHAIERVLANVIHNACKYSPPVSRVTHFGRGRWGDPGLRVADEGVGIPAGDSDRVFEPFFRRSAATPAGEQGSGLGLAICRSILTAHGGRISG